MVHRTPTAPIVYLLDQAPLFGGVKVVLDQANLLTEAGHQVTVRCTGHQPEWMEVSCDWMVTDDLASNPEECQRDGSVVVGTYWTTLGPAVRLAAAGRALHYCQGYEASYSHNQEQHAQIRSAYALPLPAITVAQHLADFIQRRYSRSARVVKQPLPESFVPRPEHEAPAARSGSDRPPRVLVMSPLEIDWKGVATALEALQRVRSKGVEFELVRLSQFQCSDAEREYQLGGEFHWHLSPQQVPELVRGCDLLLAPSWEAEGFGLPVLEAIASGVPSIASEVPCYRDWTGGAVELVAPRAVERWAEAITAVLLNAQKWESLRRRGLAVASEYSANESLRSMEQAIACLVGTSDERSSC